MLLNAKLYRVIQKGLLEELDLNGLDIEELNDVRIKKVSNSKRSILKAYQYDINYQLQSLIDSRNYSIEDVYDLVNKGATYKTNNDNLKDIIEKHIEIAGNECDLNWIDTSEVTDMSELFKHSLFNGDISKWDVSNVGNMGGMFDVSKFNGDISNWNVSNVTDMSRTFCCSQFNGNISSWDVSNVTNMKSMFAFSKFNGDISNWDIYNVTNMRCMFYYSKFNRDISNWNIKYTCDTKDMFENCPIKNEYKPKYLRY